MDKLSAMTQQLSEVCINFMICNFAEDVFCKKEVSGKCSVVF